LEILTKKNNKKIYELVFNVVFTLYQNIPLYYVDNGIDCTNQLYCLIPTKSCISPGCVLDLSHLTL